MNKILITMVCMALGVFVSKAQTKGTNMVGFGVTYTSTEDEVSYSALNEERRAYSLTYGTFVKDNVRIGLAASLSQTTEGRILNGFWTGKVHYQYYYPLLKKFYAIAGGSAMYGQGKEEYGDDEMTFRKYNYSIGAYGGAAWFLSKRFAFETNLISADFSYSKTKAGANVGKHEASVLDISTTGFINDLSFGIFFLF